jgi:hypothetical protein
LNDETMAFRMFLSGFVWKYATVQYPIDPLVHQCSSPFPYKNTHKNWWYTSFSDKSKPYLDSPQGPRPASASKLLFTGPKCLAAADGRSLCAKPYGLYQMFLVKLGSDASHCYASLLWRNHHSAQCDLVASPMKFGVFFNLRGCLGFTAHVTPPAPRVCWVLCRWSAVHPWWLICWIISLQCSTSSRLVVSNDSCRESSFSSIFPAFQTQQRSVTHITDEPGPERVPWRTPTLFT